MLTRSTIRRVINAWIAWRARRRLQTLPGWREAHDAMLQARARHGRSQVGLRAMRDAVNAALVRETCRKHKEFPR